MRFPMTWCKAFQLIYVVTLVGTHNADANSIDGMNARQFGILCGIYNVAANVPTTFYKTAEVDTIRDEIDVFNASLSDNSWFDHVARTSEGTKPETDPKTQQEESPGLQARWKKAVSRALEEKKHLKNQVMGERLMAARRKLENIEKQVGQVIARLQQTNPAKELRDAKEKFDLAIGEGECEAKAATCGVSEGRGQATCGALDGTAPNGSGKKAGEILIVDFLCLCAAHTGNTQATTATGKECTDPTSKVPHSTAKWDSGAPSGAKVLWNELKAECAKSHTSGTTTVAQAEAAIQSFLGEIAGAVKTTGGTPQSGRLDACHGNCGSGTYCDGNYNSNKGICVVYGKTPADWAKIGWLANFQAGIQHLRAAEEKFVTVQRELARLNMLRDRAEEIYETTKLDSENYQINPVKTTPSQNSSKIPATSTDKMDANERPALSEAGNPRFILPWTFLL